MVQNYVNKITPRHIKKTLTQALTKLKDSERPLIEPVISIKHQKILIITKYEVKVVKNPKKKLPLLT